MPLIEETDQVRFEWTDRRPAAGNIALAAFYNGWEFRLELILFREGKNGLEGYNDAADRWIPANRFRTLGIVVYLGITSDSLQQSVGQNDGIVFDEKLVAEYRNARRWGRVRILLGLDWPAAKIPMALIAMALGNDFLPNAKRFAGTFVTTLTAKDILGASDLVRQYTRLHFEEEATVEPRAGLIALAAYEEDSGHVTAGPVELVEREGELWAMVPNSTVALHPARFRFLRACVGGESPEGLKLNREIHTDVVQTSASRESKRDRQAVCS